MDGKAGNTVQRKKENITDGKAWKYIQSIIGKICGEKNDPLILEMVKVNLSNLLQRKGLLCLSILSGLYSRWEWE